MAKTSELVELTAPTGDVQVPVVDTRETSIASKSKRLSLKRLAENQGDYAEPTPGQQADMQAAFGLAPSGAITDDDIGGRSGTSWRMTTSSQFSTYPNRASSGTQAEKRGHGVMTLSGKIHTLRLSRFTLFYSSGVSRRDASTALNSIRRGDTVQLGPWSARSGGATITAQFFVTATPVYTPATESYEFPLRQINTGAVITTGHLAPSGPDHPFFGVSLGIRAQKPLSLSDTAPQRLGSSASAGTSLHASRGDHVHPTPGVPIVVLADGESVAWNASQAPNAKVTLAGDRAMAEPTGLVDGGMYLLTVIQDSTGGRSLSFPAKFRFNGIGVTTGTPALAGGAGARTVFAFLHEDSVMRCLSRIQGA